MARGGQYRKKNIFKVQLCICIGYGFNKNEQDLIRADGSLLELHCIRLCLLAHLFQVFVYFKDEKEEKEKEEIKNCDCLSPDLTKQIQYLNLIVNKSNLINIEVLYKVHILIAF